ncbi:MAG: ABC transporter permease [Acidobacteria bacterium]|nr:ABC transporter permease [Acidobacteriota bacterium]
MSVAGLLALWELGARAVATGEGPAVFFPGLSRVLAAGTELIGSSDFWWAMWVSNLRVLLGFLSAALFAIPIGVFLGAFPRAAGFVAPITDFGRYLPIPALVPLSIIWAGVGDFQKILLLFIGTFFHILVMVTDSIRRVPQLHVDSAMTLGANPIRVVLGVLVPASLPQIFDACRVGVALTWSYLLVAELVASQAGLGALIIRSQRFLQTDRIFFTIFILGFLGLLYDRFFTILRPRIFAWAQEGRHDGG